MDSNLNVLEAKVLEAVELIKELRARNQELAAQCDELQARIQELESTNQRLEHDLGESRQATADVETYEAKRKEIEDKVGGLLAQLEALG
jgi:chaperonin cofactor prefoldin